MQVGGGSLIFIREKREAHILNYSQEREGGGQENLHQPHPLLLINDWPQKYIC